MQIPFMRLDRQFANHRQEFMDAVETVFTHGKVLQAQEVADLETRVAEFFALPQAVAVGSGTDALILAMKALGLKPGGRVAVTSLSFVASASAIVHAGGIPVFVDIEDDSFLAREDVLLDLVRSGRVDGVVAVHLYGQMTELAEIHAEAQKRGVFVIEDAAQALGATRHGTPPGAHSDVTCVSFDPTKVIGAQGSGGLALARELHIAEHLKRLRYHGHAGGRIYTEIGHNSQLPTVQAAVIAAKLNHEEAWRLRRLAIASAFTETLAKLPNIRPPKVRQGNTHIFHKYAMTVQSGRDALARHLKQRGIGSSVHYSLPLSEQPCFAGIHETAGDMRVVKRATGRLLSLPIYPELTDTEVEYICEALRAFQG
ncbi:MAG: putative DegT/DnrJ/EryC1/StrS [Desulfovibrionaceae bacterium]|nr:MAG: putative DegT/DnrJ/EryC1/StrS [Desulfovibrionaceae bacterium]